MSAVIQELQDKYFQEYKTLSTPEDIQADNVKWNGVKYTIHTFSLDEQSQYADYVTRHVCADVDGSPSLAKELLKHLKRDIGALPPNFPLNEAAIGGFALIFKTLEPHCSDDVLKPLREAFEKKVLETQQHIQLTRMLRPMRH